MSGGDGGGDASVLAQGHRGFGHVGDLYKELDARSYIGYAIGDRAVVLVKDLRQGGNDADPASGTLDGCECLRARRYRDRARESQGTES